MAIERIGVVGTGAMGRGIIQLFAQAGLTVYCFDMAPGAAEEAIVYVQKMIQRSIDKERLPAELATTLPEQLIICNQLKDLVSCDLVVEAIVENVTVKQNLFAELEAFVDSDTILATNTSSLVVADIAARCQHPERVAGLHFFNPVPLMKVAEVIAAVRTDTKVVGELKSVVELAGHRAVVTEDQPGFLVNHAGRGLYTEGLRIVEEQVATPADIDTIMREAGGFKMGPFELMDLTGLDVSGKVMESIYQQFQQEPRFRPSSLVAPRIAAGLFGRKTGAGWYRYLNNEQQLFERASPPALNTSAKVWIDQAADQKQTLFEIVTNAGLSIVETAITADLCLIQPWGEDASHYCARLGLPAENAVAVDPLPGLDKHRTLMLSAITSGAARDLAHALLTSDGVCATIINDSPGFILQRVLATIVNIASNIVQRGIATVEDLEDAVRLGLGYPKGPLAIGEQVGGNKILHILQQMLSLTGDPRYRCTLWLSRRVALGQSLLLQESQRA